MSIQMHRELTPIMGFLPFNSSVPLPKVLGEKLEIWVGDMEEPVPKNRLVAFRAICYGLVVSNNPLVVLVFICLFLLLGF